MGAERRSSAARLLAHLERDLGEYTGKGVGSRESTLDFSILQFADRPAVGATCSVTFGISTHRLTAGDGRAHRQEALVFLRDEEAALQICANVGAYLLDEHVALLEGETSGYASRARHGARPTGGREARPALLEARTL